jgi:hypothetical protein
LVVPAAPEVHALISSGTATMTDPPCRPTLVGPNIDCGITLQSNSLVGCTQMATGRSCRAMGGRFSLQNERAQHRGLRNSRQGAESRPYPEESPSHTRNPLDRWDRAFGMRSPQDERKTIRPVRHRLHDEQLV